MKKFKVLSLDGGGSKGVYSLGILYEIESKLGSALVNHFDAFYGTSTGSIISCLLAKGMLVNDIKVIYTEKIPWVMASPKRKERTRRLRDVLYEQFHDEKPDVFKKSVGVVATSIDEKSPKIFKSSVEAAHQTKASFEPFFGCTIVDALMASCAAFPFFEKIKLKTTNAQLELMDGGFCANNPTMFALIDASKAFKKEFKDIVIISVGAGEFPRVETLLEKVANLVPGTPARFVGDILETSSNTTTLITKLLFSASTNILRLNSASTDPTLAVNFLEKDKNKLEKIYIKGRTTFRESEHEFEKIFN